MMRKLAALALMCLTLTIAHAQKVGVKTNLLYDATATLNLGVELGLGKKTSLDISGNYNGFDFSDNKKWKHWLIQPELRYWTCQKFSRHFWGIHAHYAHFNVGGIKLPFGIFPSLENRRYQGDAYGAGIAYGYHWILGKRWGLEASIGAGYMRMNYTQFRCKACGENLGKQHKNYWGPTKAAISIIYLIK